MLAPSDSAHRIAQRIPPIMISGRRVSSNPRNNRQLPQNLWDVIERSG